MKNEVNERLQNHGLASGIVYGPVLSRRFGSTLGINLLPAGRKHCSFNCVYCQLGWSDRGYVPKESGFPPTAAVIAELEGCLKSTLWQNGVSHIVVSGNGEPTLHPDFENVTKALHGFRDKFLPTAKTACFTCGSELENDAVFRALKLFDECHVKLDADLKSVDLPPQSFDAETVLPRASGLENLVIQSCFMKGVIDNSGEASVARWADAVFRLSPRRAVLYTIERATAAEGLMAVSVERLHEVAEVLRCRGVVEVNVV